MTANHDLINRARALLGGELRPFIGYTQRAAISSFLQDEEAEHYAERLLTLGARIASMPVTYQQDGLGRAAVAHLHYFYGSGDWWITEKDVDGGTPQAFGLASIYGEGSAGGELGYISIDELTRNGIELDLYFEPTRLDQL